MMGPETPLQAGLDSLVVAALLFVFGLLLANAVTSRLGLSTTVRLALAVPALAAFVCLVAVVHIISGGEVLSRPGLVIGGTVLVTLALIARLVLRPGGKRTPFWRDGDVLLVAGLALLAVAIWCLPVFTNVPVSFHGDVKRHMAWAAQLSAGHTTPTGVITGEIPNYYPWLFHAFTSFTAAFTPGGRVLHALGPIQVLLVAGNLFGFFAVGREVFGSRAAAGAAALLGSLSGGFGFLLTRAPDLVMDPRFPEEVARYEGDFMFNRSYNLAFHNLAPPFPRDLAFGLLIVMMLLLTIGVKQRRASLFVGAGVALGLIGLTAGESVVVAALFAFLLVCLGPGIPRLNAAVAVFVSAFVVYSLWLLPVMLNYARLGGFADTAGVPVELPARMIVFSWGVAVPLAAFGVLSIRRWRSPGGIVVVSYALATLIAVAAAGLAPRIDEGFMTLSRHHRYWPLVYVAVALAGACGAHVLWERLWAIRPSLVALPAAAVVFAAIASPVMGTIAVTRLPVENKDLTDALLGDERNVLDVLGRTQGRRCELAAPQELSRVVPAHTGARLVYFPGNTRNQAGIRWPELPDVVTDAVRMLDHKTLISGEADEAEWSRVVERYGVDRVIVSGTPAAWITNAYPTTPAEGNSDDYVVVETGPCS